jgi:arginine decarboxylase
MKKNSGALLKPDPCQRKTPFLSALKAYVDSHPAAFDVPGHKMGCFPTDLSRKISNVFFEYDANSPYGLDNLYNPTGVVKEAEELAAKACHADHCLFSVNGTTGGILTMFLACLSLKDKVILPRNVHRSVINALIISGAVPIFVTPYIDADLGIADGPSVEAMITAMDENPTAKAVFLINPTYFGVVADLKRIVKEAHKRNMLVMTDEAHGSNFYFSSELPASAMEAGADITAMSMHKNSGSLTQTSLILTQGKRIDFARVRRSYGMLTTTSPNSILISSLDAARKEMVFHGPEIIHKDLVIARRLRKAIQKIPGLAVIGTDYPQHCASTGVIGIDETKLIISVKGLGLYGYDVYKELRIKYNVQVELGEVSVILAIVGPGTGQWQEKRLLDALRGLSHDYYQKNKKRRSLAFSYGFPSTIVPPFEAFDAPSKKVSFDKAIGEISAETIMAYPPGIPLVIPGEVVTADAVGMIRFFQKEGGEVLKDCEPDKIKVIDRTHWYLADEIHMLGHGS